MLLCLICELDNGRVYQLQDGSYLASQWEGVSEPFETFEEAYNWVMAGCT